MKHLIESQGSKVTFNGKGQSKMDNQLTALLTALNKVQGELKPVEKSKSNPHFRSKYATLEDILEVSIPLLSKHGLVLIQSLAGTETSPTLETIIAHVSGQNIKSTAPLFCKELTSQGLGSAITYMRRYSLMAILGISTTDEDDDGNRASKPTPQKPMITEKVAQTLKTQPPTQPKPAIQPSIPMTQKLVNMAPTGPGPQKLSDAQVSRLFAIGRSNSWDRVALVEWTNSFFGKIPDHLSRQEYEDACEFVQKNSPKDPNVKSVMKESSFDDVPFPSDSDLPF
jgi:hypothetical protein